MWGTNVARAAYRYTWKECNRSDRYIEYLNDIEQLNVGEALLERVRSAIGASSALRCKKFVLSQLGIAESARRSSASEISDYPFSPETFSLNLGIEEDNE